MMANLGMLGGHIGRMLALIGRGSWFDTRCRHVTFSYYTKQYKHSFFILKKNNRAQYVDKTHRQTESMSKQNDFRYQFQIECTNFLDGSIIKQ